MSTEDTGTRRAVDLAVLKERLDEVTRTLTEIKAILEDQRDSNRGMDRRVLRLEVGVSLAFTLLGLGVAAAKLFL